MGKQVEGTSQRRGVEEHDLPADWGTNGNPVAKHPGNHLLVGADGLQGIGAGQVLDDHVGIPHPVPPLVASDGDPRVVAGLGAQSGQRVEQRRLAAVRATHQHEAQDAMGLGCGSDP